MVELVISKEVETMANNIEEVQGISKILAPITIGGKKVESAKHPKLVFSQYITPPTDDWRDYMSNWYIYLPYVGVIQLDPERYINHKMSCLLMFDIRTGALKYDLLSDDVLMESHSGAIRQTFPVTAASPYTTSFNKLTGAVESVVGGAANVASGHLLGAAGTIARGFTDVIKPIPKKSTGGFSPAVNLFDSLHIYIMIESPDIYYGDGIRERYGMPDNRFVSIGSLSGYVELADVELSTSATEAELEEIESLLLAGVVI